MLVAVGYERAEWLTIRDDDGRSGGGGGFDGSGGNSAVGKARVAESRGGGGEAKDNGEELHYEGRLGWVSRIGKFV